MTRVANYTNVTDPHLLGALNEELSELRRRVSRHSEKYERIEGVKVGTDPTRIPHRMGLIPRSVHIEIIEFNGFAFPDVWFAKRHTKDEIFLRASAETTVDVVLRG